MGRVKEEARDKKGLCKVHGEFGGGTNVGLPSVPEPLTPDESLRVVSTHARTSKLTKACCQSGCSCVS